MPAPLRSLILLLMLFLVAPAPMALASHFDLSPFFGTYVGTATVTDAETGVTEQRDMDIVVAPYRSGGFHIRWINVTLVDGRRDVPGVERRVEEVTFTPSSSHGLYTE